MCQWVVLCAPKSKRSGQLAHEKAAAHIREVKQMMENSAASWKKTLSWKWRYRRREAQQRKRRRKKTKHKPQSLGHVAVHLNSSSGRGRCGRSRSPRSCPCLCNTWRRSCLGRVGGVIQVVQRLCLALGHQFGLRLFPNGIQGDTRKGETEGETEGGREGGRGCAGEGVEQWSK